MPRELYPPTWRCFQLWQTHYTHHRIFSRHCFRNKHFSPQHPMCNPLSSRAYLLLHFPFIKGSRGSFIYIYISFLDTSFHAVLHSVFRFATFTDIPLSGLFIHWNDFLQRPLHGICIILVARDRFIEVIMQGRGGGMKC